MTGRDLLEFLSKLREDQLNLEVIVDAETRVECDECGEENIVEPTKIVEIESQSRNQRIVLIGEI